MTFFLINAGLFFIVYHLLQPTTTKALSPSLFELDMTASTFKVEALQSGTAEEANKLEDSAPRASNSTEFEAGTNPIPRQNSNSKAKEVIVRETKQETTEESKTNTDSIQLTTVKGAAPKPSQPVAPGELELANAAAIAKEIAVLTKEKEALELEVGIKIKQREIEESKRKVKRVREEVDALRGQWGEAKVKAEGIREWEGKMF